MKVLKKLIALTLVALVLVVGFVSSVSKVLAAAGEGTATIAVDGGTQGANVTVVQSTSHTFTVVLTVSVSGMTLGASSPTFTIPTGFTAPNLHAVATAGDVDVDGEWSVVAAAGSGVGGCTVSSAPGSATTTATGQVITVDVTADCAFNNLITLTYQGTSSIAMGATALEVRTADGAPAAALIASSPTITVTAAPTSTPTPTPAGGSSSGSGSDLANVSSTSVCSPLSNISPIIIDSRRIDADSIFISWGPYSGTNTFIVQYGLTSESLMYSTNVTGFSTTLNGIPANQPISVRIAARNNCSIGKYGAIKLVGVPNLPNTGLSSRRNNLPWITMANIFIVASILVLIRRNRKRTMS